LTDWKLGLMAGYHVEPEKGVKTVRLKLGEKK
jgi:hypothetical protein